MFNHYIGIVGFNRDNMNKPLLCVQLQMFVNRGINNGCYLYMLTSNSGVVLKLQAM